ncbi:MAG: peptidoglycan-binding protein [Archangium sp.]|nr:peptidoglycan-binding protein [Archangium sp.]
MEITNSPSPSTSPEADTTLTRGARGPAVADAQNLLLRAGNSLTRYGADGQFGAETTQAIARFQLAHGITASGNLDSQTLRALAEAAPARPDYGALFADGLLRGVVAVGFDEVDSHLPEQRELISGLAQRGFRAVTDEERAELGLGTVGQFLIRSFEHEGKPVRAVFEIVTAETPDAKARFAAAFKSSEVVLYGGHGRYGSGPDFDHIASASGNFVIGAPFEAGHVTLGPVDLGPLTPEYQVMFFDGCNTFRYFDDLRARSGKGIDKLDVIGSNAELYWNDTAENLLAALDALSSGEDLEQLNSRLDRINSAPVGTHAFRPDGFDDNGTP